MYCVFALKIELKNIMFIIFKKKINFNFKLASIRD